MKVRSCFVRLLGGTLALAVMLTAGAIAAHAQSVSSYSGNAYVVRTDENSSATIFGSTGSLPPAGGSQTGSLGSFGDAYGFTTLSSGTSSTSGAAGTATSTSTVNGFSFNNGYITVTADSMTVISTATTSGTNVSTLFTNLSISGTAFQNFTGAIAANTVVNFGGDSGTGTLTINKQTDTSSAGHNEITGQALDFFDSGRLEVNAAVANSDVSFAPIPEPAFYQMSALLVFGGLGLWRVRRRRTA